MSELEGGDAKPNLTPMLDMVFQLITFFMLVINFKSAVLDLSLRLPVIGSARPVETSGEEFLILNISKEGDLKVSGNREDITTYIAREAAASRLTAKRLGANEQDEDELATTVVIRADQDTPFHQLNHVIKTCQDNGFRRFALKAVNQAGGG